MSTASSSRATHGDSSQPAPATSKKAKGKRPVEANEAMLVAQRISQLEQDAAGEKDQEAEIEREVRKMGKDLQQQVSELQIVQKIESLTKKCTELYADMKRLEKENLKTKKRADTLQKEKDQNRTELNKNIGLKEKLEKLCRELQKENNKLKNESKILSDRAVQHEQAWDEKYALLLGKLDGIQDMSDGLRKDNIPMEVEELFNLRFKSFIDQYELRDLHFHSVMRTKELEVQHNAARFERERKALQEEMNLTRQLNAQVQTFTKTETELRNQLNVYVEKFKQVEDTLNNSNDLFLTFRKEMEDMSKKTKKLEKENEALKRKHEAMNQNIVKMAAERTKNLNDLSEARNKASKLTNIINAMQKQGRGVPPVAAAPTPGPGQNGTGNAANNSRNHQQQPPQQPHSNGGVYVDGDDESVRAEVDEDSEYGDGFDDAPESEEVDDDDDDDDDDEEDDDVEDESDEDEAAGAPAKAAATTTNGHR